MPCETNKSANTSLPCDSGTDLLKYVNYKYREPICSGILPVWKCPYCKTGTLHLDDDDFRHEETDESKTDRDDPNWEPDWIKYTFTAFLQCTNCNDQTAVIGEGKSKSYTDQQTGEILVDKEFMPKYFCPTLPLFELPPETPEKVRTHIHESFSLAWADFSAAGNKLRISIERLIDEISPKSKGNLHQKIENLKEPWNEIKEQLEAIKWLGNNGSHEAKLDEYDTAFAYKVLKIILEKIYDSNEDVEKLVQRVNSAKGPPIKKAQ